MSKMKRNFIGEKDLSRKAASFRIAMEVVKSGNEETIQKSAQSIRMLANFAKEEYGLKNISRLDSLQMADFAHRLLEKRENGEISAGHTTNIISSLNTVFTHYYRDDLKISAKEYGLNRGQRFNNVDKSVSADIHKKFSEFLTESYIKHGDVRYKALRLQVELQRGIGLRFKESALFSGKELHRNGNLNIRKGTKGGQLRTLQSTEKQRELVREVKDFRKESNLKTSLIPDGMSFKEWRHFAYNTVKEFNKEIGLKYNFHGERHHYAQSRYKELTGYEPPVKSNGETFIDKEKDYQIRLIISEELGHHRVDITNFYIGRR